MDGKDRVKALSGKEIERKKIPIIVIPFGTDLFQDTIIIPPSFK